MGKISKITWDTIMKVGFITMEKATNRDKNSVGSSRIRARWVAKYWDDAEEWILGEKYDVLIFQKVYWDEMMDGFSGIKILDICDPDWLENHDVMKYVDKCDAVTTSTEPLAEYIRKFYPDKPIVCIPDRVDLAEHKHVKEEHPETLSHFVWFGYAQNADCLVQTFDTLNAMKAKLTIYSDTQVFASTNHKDLVIEWKRYEYNRIQQDLHNYDAALLPDRSNDYRGKFKSNNKVLTCMALGIPVVTNPQDIDRLMSKEARVKASKDGIAEVKKKWDVKLSVEEYKSLIKNLSKK